jgi:hypothetical protein
MNFNSAQTRNQDSVFVRDSNQVLLNARLAYHKRSYFPEFEKLACLFLCGIHILVGRQEGTPKRGSTRVDERIILK